MTSILVLALLLAQQAAPPEKCTLAGTVVDSVTGMPLGKAIVVAERGSGGDDDASTMTDAKGNFVMIDVEPGQYHLAAQRRGYTEGYYGARRASGTGTRSLSRQERRLKILGSNWCRLVLSQAL